MEALRRKLSIVSVVSVVALGILAAPAFGAANPQRANCFALFVSNQPPGEVGVSASSNARDPEARPLGLNVVSFTAHLREPDCFG
jgi:hypothetical protein